MILLQTVVAVWQWATYHLKENFAHPFGYHPERFLHDPRFAGDKLEILQPFSVGPRNCIGRRSASSLSLSLLYLVVVYLMMADNCLFPSLAYAEMRLILARILYNFDIVLADEGVDWLKQNAAVLWEKLPLRVHLTPVR